MPLPAADPMTRLLKTSHEMNRIHFDGPFPLSLSLSLSFIIITIIIIIINIIIYDLYPSGVH